MSWERSGSVEECLARHRGAAGLSLTSVTALWSLTRHIHPSLVLVQPRKKRLYITERLLMGRNESNQTKNLQTRVRSYVPPTGRVGDIWVLMRNPSVLASVSTFISMHYLLNQLMDFHQSCIDTLVGEGEELNIFW